MPRDPQFVAYVTEKIKELETLLTANLLLPPEIAAPGIAQAKEIARELQGHGLMICWKATLDSSDPDNCSVRIEVFQPKANLSPEDQRIYDEWFCRVNGLPPPS